MMPYRKSLKQYFDTIKSYEGEIALKDSKSFKFFLTTSLQKITMDCICNRCYPTLANYGRLENKCGCLFFDFRKPTVKSSKPPEIKFVKTLIVISRYYLKIYFQV